MAENEKNPPTKPRDCGRPHPQPYCVCDQCDIARDNEDGSKPIR